MLNYVINEVEITIPERRKPFVRVLQYNETTLVAVLHDFNRDLEGQTGMSGKLCDADECMDSDSQNSVLLNKSTVIFYFTPSAIPNSFD